MAMGSRRKLERQEDLWIPAGSIVETPGHAFYDRLEELLRQHRFDAAVEHLCRRYYRGPAGRPSIPPGVYFRMMLIGYFEGLDSERGIAWRVADSLSLRKFLGYGLDEKTPDHSTISRTRRLYWLSTHKAVFAWVLRVARAEGLVRGETVAVDATTLEANAAMRSIIRRDSGQGYEEYVRRLAAEAGMEKPTREQLARFDRKRKKKGSNQEWKSPHDPDARITKMKDGRTHLAHKAEHAVDLSSGAVLAVTLQPADRGDTTSIFETLDTARQMAAAAGVEIEEVVLDKGYHSDDVLVGLHGESIRSYISEPDRGRRRWKDKKLERELVYGNRRRLRGNRSKKLHKKRAELGERTFAHMYETGGMRRLHLRGRNNALKRLLIQGAAFNLGLVMRKVLGVGTPRGLKDLMAHILAFIEPLSTFWSAYRPSSVLVGRLVRLLKRLRPLVSPALSSHVAA
jgi:transposase